MSISAWFEKKLIDLGRDNKSTFVVVGVAIAKGIFRPIYTMSDKKQDQETKKYTAIREGLTEAIAIPIYLVSGKMAEVLANKIAKPKDMSKDIFQKIINSEKSVDIEAKNLKKNLFKTRTTLTMLGVFLSAFILIPATCSIIIKPLMKLIQKPKRVESNSVQQPELPEELVKPAFKRREVLNRYYIGNSNYGMKVGGV